jgi:phosphoglycolate phosphatase-like HAD superfamily hydrolase
MKSAPAVLGLRAHSGWAALIALAGPADAPQVVDRRRIEMAEGEEAKQPYHAAKGLPLSKASALLDRLAKRACTRATEGLAAALEDLRGKGHAPTSAVILTASGRPLPELKSVLASHALIHTADGEHFRDALAEASRHHGLEVTRVREKDVLAQAAAALRRPGADVQAAVAAWGKPLGAPWTQDQKLSALGAWLALAGRK